MISGWRQSDGSAPLATLGRRLAPFGPAPTPGPLLGDRARRLELAVTAAAGGVQVSADLRDRAGAVIQRQLGTATPRRRSVAASLPPGGFELEALQLSEPAGLQATNGHQNGENPAAATQFTTAVSLGPLEVLRSGGQRLRRVALVGWRAVGAAATSSPSRATPRMLRIRFSDSGSPGVLRPPQPSDSRPIPILVDPHTAAAAPDRRIALTVDGLPVTGHIVGVLRRFPTLAPGGAGFIVADEATLGAALDASLPGQGRPDELWIDTSRPAALRAALAQPPLRILSATFRADVERRLRSDPIARGVVGTLLAAAGIGLSLALAGLLGPMRDERAERELEVYGLGPRALARELRLRIVVAAAFGLLAGFALAAALTRLAVAAVGSSDTLAPPRPPLVTVAPWQELVLLALAALAGSWIASWIATSPAVARRREL